MKFRALPLSLVAGLLLAAGAIAASQLSQYAFPHLRHERLFPVCEGCHAGVPSGVGAETYPTPEVCAQCHDGNRQPRVNWRQPGPRSSNLRFTHPRHIELSLAAGDSITCQNCHALGTNGSRMSVGAPRPDLCAQCHAHRSETHLSPAAACTGCHIPLAEATSLATERLAAFPRPAWHDAANFLSTHGRDTSLSSASCAVCHARESCQRCHANWESVPMIAALASDSRIAELTSERLADYPVPASHASRDWPLVHGASARGDYTSCANCHTRPSCTGCHIGGSGSSRAAIASLPEHFAGAAPGVDTSLITSVVHPSDIATRHGTLAASGKLDCAQCHSQQTCTSCHAGSDSRAFHAPNFVERHAVDVFSGGSDCQSCHNTQAFCRDCHTRTGIASSGHMNAAFHTGQPLWVLSHGQAARTGMESCASCHQQSDCIRCHSAVGGWRVNPHGPDFPARRLSARNAASCSWCHISNPAGGT